MSREAGEDARPTMFTLTCSRVSYVHPKGLVQMSLDIGGLTKF